MRAYLIRHPAAVVGAEICYGASDPAPAPDALACAHRLRAILPPAIALYSSPLRRCRALAQVLDPFPIFDERLREMDFGAWEMRAWADIARAEIDAWSADPLGYEPPAGESVRAVQARVRSFVRERILVLGDDCAVVTHAGIMKILVAEARGLAPADWLALRFAYGESCIVDFPD